MINSFSRTSHGEIIYPGIVLYNSAIEISDSDLSDIYSSYQHMSENADKYNELKIKNTFFHALNKINKINLAEKIQKSILHYFAKYCEIYDEVIHTVQWQENIFIDVEYSGENSFIYNPNKSFIEEGKIKNTPFSRQVAVEVIVDNDYEGGHIEWEYLGGIKIKQMQRGAIIFYPSNYLFSKKHHTIISGRKISLTTFFNGGKDFLAEENNTEDADINMLSSYMR
jgi:hypothetical protein